MCNTSCHDGCYPCCVTLVLKIIFQNATAADGYKGHGTKISVNWESGGGVVGGPLSLAPEAQGEGDWQHRKGAQGQTSWFSNLYI